MSSTSWRVASVVGSTTITATSAVLAASAGPISLSAISVIVILFSDSPENANSLAIVSRLGPNPLLAITNRCPIKRRGDSGPLDGLSSAASVSSVDFGSLRDAEAELACKAGAAAGVTAALVEGSGSSLDGAKLCEV